MRPVSLRIFLPVYCADADGARLEGLRRSLVTAASRERGAVLDISGRRLQDQLGSYRDDHLAGLVP